MAADSPRPLVLASASPRRRALLAELKVPFEVQAATRDEPSLPATHPRPPELAMALAYFKARDVLHARNGNARVLGADTIVVDANDPPALLGKPANRDDAAAMLDRLLGQRCDVLTGLALLNGSTSRREMRAVQTTLTLATPPTDTIQRYLDAGTWKGKAGGLAVQDLGDDRDAWIARVDGSWSNVVGLPLEKVAEWLGVQR